MIPLREVLRIHSDIIERFGGSNGVKDISALKSALKRPFQTFDQTELYPSLIEKAASLIESILNNHPFIDGNKRTWYVVMKLFLQNHGLEIKASQNDKYGFVINIAEGKMDFESILDWLKTNCV